MPSDTRGLDFRCWLAATVLLSAIQLGGDALRMINLDAPDVALQGDTIHISCFFSLQSGTTSSSSSTAAVATNHRQTPQTSLTSASLPSSVVAYKSKLSALEAELNKEATTVDETVSEPEVLYAIKWYKDEREFFRYLAQDRPRKQALPTDGILVDVDKSDNHTVVLRGVSLKTSGLFRCEVSTDAPNFVTKSMERKMLIYSLPNQGPIIEPLGTLALPQLTLTATNGPKAIRYFLGERVELVCSAPESKPAATLDWIINDSLNLSAAALLADQVPLFEVKSQRFVRLPPAADGSIKSVSSGSRVPDTSPVVVLARPSTIAPSHVTFELQNGTLALPYPKDATRSSVSLAAQLLDQLPEVSVSRLNFTVDANLLQLVSLDKFDALSAKVSRRELGLLQASSEYNANDDGEGTNQTAARPPSKLRSSSSQLFATTTRATERQQQPILANKSKRIDLAQDLSKVAAHSPGSKRHLDPLFVSDFLNVRKKMATHRNGVANNAHNHKLLLKIKCVARVLHLSMSDEIKIRLANKTRELVQVGDDSTTTGAQRRQHPLDKSSGKHFGLIETTLLLAHPKLIPISVNFETIGSSSSMKLSNWQLLILSSISIAVLFVF